MENIAITVEKTPGGIGSDAWTASLKFDGQQTSLSARARGESRQQAKESLRNELARVLREVGTIANELGQ